MGQMRCGCEAALEASKVEDLASRRADLIGAGELQRMWGCPGSGTEVAPEKPVTPHAREALEAVRRVCGLSDLTTCPRWYAMQPGPKRVADAFEWLREGGIETAFGRDPPHALIQAVQLVRRAYNLRREDDEKRDKK